MVFESGNIIKLDLKTNQYTSENLPQIEARKFTPSKPRAINFIENLLTDEFLLLSEFDCYSSVQAIVEIQNSECL